MAILKACGLKLEFDEVYEDYQRIYDKTMEMQDEKMNERGESVRGRARQSALESVNYMQIIEENDVCAMYFTVLKEKNCEKKYN